MMINDIEEVYQTLRKNILLEIPRQQCKPGTNYIVSGSVYCVQDAKLGLEPSAWKTEKFSFKELSFFSNPAYQYLFCDPAHAVANTKLFEDYVNGRINTIQLYNSLKGPVISLLPSTNVYNNV
jgi:hypothetical protein